MTFHCTHAHTNTYNSQKWLPLSYDIKIKLFLTLIVCWELNGCIPHATCWNLIPNVMIFGDRVIGRWLDHEGRALLGIEVSVLITEQPQSSLTSSTIWGHKNRWPLWTRKLSTPDTEFAGTNLGLSDSRIVGEINSVLRHLMCGILLLQSEWAKIIPVMFPEGLIIRHMQVSSSQMPHDSCTSSTKHYPQLYLYSFQLNSNSSSRLCHGKLSFKFRSSLFSDIQIQILPFSLAFPWGPSCILPLHLPVFFFSQMFWYIFVSHNSCIIFIICYFYIWISLQTVTKVMKSKNSCS